MVESGLIAEVSKSSEVTQSGLSGELNASDVDGDDLIFSIKSGSESADQGISSIDSFSFLTSSIDTSGMAWGVALSPDGSTAFVADSESGMQVVDISDPGSPLLIATTPTSGYVSDVTLSTDGTIAFVTDGYGLEIVDVSNPVKPNSMYSLETSGYSTDVILSSDGTVAFVAAGSSGVQIIDVGDPSNPALLTSLGTSADASKVTLSPDGDIAFVTSFSTSSGIQIFDISNLTKPNLIATIDHSGYVMDFALSSDGDTVFLVDYGAGLQIIDISDLSTPSLLATYNPSGSTQVLTLSSDGNTALLTEDGVGVHVLDISTRSAPSLIGIIDAIDDSVDSNASGSGYLVDIALSSDDNIALVANTGIGLQIFNVRDFIPSNFGYTDHSIDHSHLNAIKQGDYGVLTLDVLTGQYSYTSDPSLIEALDANEIVSDTFTFAVSDGDGADVTEDFSIHLVGAADVPTISASEQFEVDEDSPLRFANDHSLLVGDVDGNLSSVTVEVEHGRFIFETTFDVVSSFYDDASFIQISGY